MKKKIAAAVAFFFTFFIFSQTGVRAEETTAATPATPASTMTVTIQEAVKVGLENSLTLKIIDKESLLSVFKIDRAIRVKDKLQGGEASVESGEKQLQEAVQQINEAQKKIDEARSVLNKGRAPMDIPIAANLAIPKGADIAQVLKSKGLEDMIPTVLQQVKQQIDGQQMQLDAKKSLLAQQSAALEIGSLKLDLSKQIVDNKITDKLNMSELERLSASSTGSLLISMATEASAVTGASQEIYKNQIALLIQKNYMDALKAQKMLEVKEKTMKRAESQFTFANEGYVNGMKAKDDMLLAKIFYTGTQMEYKKAQEEYKNALTELKKNMNLPLNTTLILKDVLAERVEKPNLDSGLESALKNRLEIKSAAAQVNVCELNFRFIEEDYGIGTPRWNEADILKQEAKLALEKAKMDVASSVYQSHETMLTLGEMLDMSKEMAAQARESVEIAKYKYSEGFGSESSLLKKMDLESSSGTILEVITAEENLAQVEEKVVEIMYGYNLARAKYFNDSGNFLY